jgi:hypothetical protein
MLGRLFSGVHIVAGTGLGGRRGVVDLVTLNCGDDVRFFAVVSSVGAEVAVDCVARAVLAVLVVLVSPVSAETFSALGCGYFDSVLESFDGVFVVAEVGRCW